MLRDQKLPEQNTVYIKNGVCFFGLDQPQLMVINKVKMLSGLEFILYCSQSTFCADCKNVPERYIVIA